MPGYQRNWLRMDIIAGLTLCAILVPEGWPAQLAGMPPETAFYAAPTGLLAYALLGNSRQLVVAVSYGSINATAESVMATLKRELTKRSAWRTRLDLELALVTYIGWYNARRHLRRSSGRASRSLTSPRRHLCGTWPWD